MKVHEYRPRLKDEDAELSWKPLTSISLKD